MLPSAQCQNLPNLKDSAGWTVMVAARITGNQSEIAQRFILRFVKVDELRIKRAGEGRRKLEKACVWRDRSRLAP